jgi:hypothetical protein
VRRIVAVYLEQLGRSPFIPGYVIGELSQHPGRAQQLMDMVRPQTEGAARCRPMRGARDGCRRISRFHRGAEDGASRFLPQRDPAMNGRIRRLTSYLMEIGG